MASSAQFHIVVSKFDPSALISAQTQVLAPIMGKTVSTFGYYTIRSHIWLIIWRKSQPMMAVAHRQDQRMLILEKARKKFRSAPKINTLLSCGIALGLSVPFGVMSAQLLQSSLAGLILGASLFTYSILLSRLLKRQPPLFLKRFFPRQEIHAHRSINEICGLRLDYVGTKDPQDSVDGVVHNRTGELQRVLRCKLPQKMGDNLQALLFEMLFADLSGFADTRFQMIVPACQGKFRQEMYLIASYKIAGTSSSCRDEKPPLTQMQEMLDRLLERLLTLGVAPRIMNSLEVRQLISEELSTCASRGQLARDWRNVGLLGWEPSFRDTVLKPCDRFMQVQERKSYTLAIESLPASNSFAWLSSTIQDLPNAQISLFLSPWSGDSLGKLALERKIKKHSKETGGLVNPAAAQMSFFIRFDGSDPYELECETSTARKYLSSLSIKSSFSTQRHMQLQNWRATLPFAQDCKSADHKHTIAFMRSRRDSLQHDV